MIAKLKRCTPGPLFVRVVAFLAAWAALAMATPEKAQTFQFILALGVVALVPALAPATRLVDIVMLMVLGTWLIGTLGFGEQVTVIGTLSTACALFLLHSAAAMAAVLPYDSIVDTVVIVRWIARSALVMGAASIVTGLIWLLMPDVPPGSSVPALLLGLGAAGGVAAMLAWAAQVRRRAM